MITVRFQPSLPGSFDVSISRDDLVERIPDADLMPNPADTVWLALDIPVEQTPILQGELVCLLGVRNHPVWS